jgi:hypothetical protein
MTTARASTPAWLTTADAVVGAARVAYAVAVAARLTEYG